MASCQPQDFIPMFSDLAAGAHNSILSLGRLRAGLHPHPDTFSITTAEQMLWARARATSSSSF